MIRAALVALLAGGCVNEYHPEYHPVSIVSVAPLHAYGAPDPDYAKLFPPTSDACGTTFASDPSWMTPFGPAAHVCESSSQPNCPSDAIVHATSGSWSADISKLDGANWIWRPGISLNDISDLVTVTFTHHFVLHGIPSGTLSIAADDFAEVDVNGVRVGTIGSTSDVSIASASQSSLTQFDITKQLVAGDNTIVVIGKNGPPAFGRCSTNCTYSRNPTGVVFGGKLDCHGLG